MSTLISTPNVSSQRHIFGKGSVDTSIDTQRQKALTEGRRFEVSTPKIEGSTPEIEKVSTPNGNIFERIVV